MRLIDADALIEKMQRIVERAVDRYGSQPFMSLSDVIKWINDEADQVYAPIEIVINPLFPEPKSKEKTMEDGGLILRREDEGDDDDKG